MAKLSELSGQYREAAIRLRVAIQDPEGNGNLAVVEVTDRAVVTSGGYQRYFERYEQ